MPASPQQNRYGDGETAGQTPLSEAAKGLAGQSGAASAGRLRQMSAIHRLELARSNHCEYTVGGSGCADYADTTRLLADIGASGDVRRPYQASEPQRSLKSREFPFLCPLSPTGELSEVDQFPTAIRQKIPGLRQLRQPTRISAPDVTAAV